MNPQDLFHKAQKVKNAHAAQSTQASVLARFGIQPSVAALFFLVDWVLFGGEIFTAMISLPLSIAIGVILGLWAIKKQRDMGDSKELSLLKGIGLATLTAIPSPVGGFLIAALGVLQLFLDKKESPDAETSSDSPTKATESSEKSPMRNVTPPKTDTNNEDELV